MGPVALVASDLSLWYSSPAALAVDSMLATILSRYSLARSAKVCSDFSCAKAGAEVPNAANDSIATAKDFGNCENQCNRVVLVDIESLQLTFSA